MSYSSPSKSAMDSKPLPVFSDFSHMSGAKGGTSHIHFAVGLREENAEEILKRVLPMTKIVPGVKKEKKVRKIEKKVEEKTCARSDCLARKDKLVELQGDNKNLRLKLKALEDKIETAKNKIALTEKSIIMAEEKNDTLNGQIESSQARIFSIEADVEKGEGFNQTLRRQLESVQAEIAEIKAQTEQSNNQLMEILEDKQDQKIVFSRDPKHKNAQLASEVSTLRFGGDDEADDSD
jgi:chromosome segregation ATPase